MTHITCHRCGGTDHDQGYGHGGPVFGMYTYCECGCLLECSPDTEGLSDAEAELCMAVAARALAFAKLNGPQRQRAERRQRRRNAWRGRRNRKYLLRMFRETEGGHPKWKDQRMSVSTTTMDDQP